MATARFTATNGDSGCRRPVLCQPISSTDFFYFFFLFLSTTDILVMTLTFFMPYEKGAGEWNIGVVVFGAG